MMACFRSLLLFLLAAFLVCCLFAKTASAHGDFPTLTPKELYDGMQSGSFDLIIDVRSQAEWDLGRIEGATFVNALNLFGTADEMSSPYDLAGCESCTIVVYCNSGNRAVTAAEILQHAGFTGKIYNGLGITQWQEAGYTLSNTVESVVPHCVANPGQCKMSTAPTFVPTFPPTFEISGGIVLGITTTASAFVVLAMTVFFGVF
eukprot:CAMPEP_0118693374 /NCGR_PEP_ID=MMETSP0800-20121206/11867_1 /TAXON_ID=210618 ORGANISM="Striatella unipunctata, Strain CCMP2910" /NCGR_SAMPLE_ID=MMETSP0800 /ASSEMBLY_ACC=CAM_ASM_000638 /LENGTH=203 /DNA_ID=CAMNT_0006591591 /DNA_START=53 /DNA_END=667 /DNA_ORIENTATION=-